MDGRRGDIAERRAASIAMKKRVYSKIVNKGVQNSDRENRKEKRARKTPTYYLLIASIEKKDIVWTAPHIAPLDF